MKGIKFYTINHKLLSTDAECIKNNQEQANTYYQSLSNYILNEDKSLEIKITNPRIIKNIENMTKLKLGEMLINVRKYKNNHAVTIYYCNGSGTTHYTISHLHCAEESNYELANEIIEYLNII